MPVEPVFLLCGAGSGTGGVYIERERRVGGRGSARERSRRVVVVFWLVAGAELKEVGGGKWEPDHARALGRPAQQQKQRGKLATMCARLCGIHEPRATVAGPPARRVLHSGWRYGRVVCGRRGSSIVLALRLTRGIEKLLKPVAIHGFRKNRSDIVLKTDLFFFKKSNTVIIVKSVFT
jgi:hypothetical protein